MWVASVILVKLLGLMIDAHFWTKRGTLSQTPVISAQGLKSLSKVLMLLEAANPFGVYCERYSRVPYCRVSDMLCAALR
jgi:hypothetical protein